MKSSKVFLITAVVLFALIALTFLIDRALKFPANFDPIKGVQGWKIYRVEESNTKVWCLARGIAKDKYDIGGVVELIAEKNPGLKESGYDLRVGDEILFPVFREK